LFTLRVKYCIKKNFRLTWVSVCQGAGNGQNRIQALEHNSVENHLAVLGLNWQISQVVAKLSQVLKGVQGIHLLQQMNCISADKESWGLGCFAEEVRNGAVGRSKKLGMQAELL
jgi:hypothetical protein